MADYNKLFEIKQFSLAAMLDKAQGAIGSKTDMEILKAFKITADGSHVRCVATDTELTVLAITESVQVLSQGSVVIPADKLIPITKQLGPEEVISVHVDTTKARIDASGIYWQVRCEDPNLYPPTPSPEDVEFQIIDRQEFSNALAHVALACSTDGLRAELMVVDVVNGFMRATDAVRYHHVEIELPFEFQLPIGAVSQLQRFLRLAVEEQIGVAMVDGMLLFKVDHDILMSNAVSTQFPDVTNVMNSVKNNKRALHVSKDQLISAINRVRINADKDTNQVELVLSTGAVRVHANNKVDEVSEATMVADWLHPDYRVVVNAEHFLDGIKAHQSQSIQILCGETDTAPISIVGDRGTTVIVRQLRL